MPVLDATSGRPARSTVPSTRLHPIYLLTETARTVRRAIPFLVVTLLGGAPWAVNAVLFGLIMAVAVAEWSVRRYSVAGGLFHLTGGLLNRTVRTVPLSRVTTVSANRSLTQRLVGTWSVRIGVPGDRRGALVTLPSLSTRRMSELRDALTLDFPMRGSPDGSGATADVPSAPVLLARLETRTLLIAAATTAMIPLLIVASLLGWLWFARFVPPVPRTFMETAVEPRGQTAVVALLVLIGLLAAVGWTLSRQYGFTAERDGGLLRAGGGFGVHRVGTMEVERVQAVRIVEGLWRGRLGYCSLQAEVAGMGRLNPLRRTIFPLLRTDRVASFVDAALPELHWRPAPLHRVTPALHRRYLTVPTAWGAGLAAAATTGLLLAGAGVLALVGVVFLPLGAVLGVARAREAAWYLDEDVLVLRWRRVLTRQTIVVRRGGIQLAQQQASIFNVRRRVSGIGIRFSSRGSAGVPYLPDDVVRHLIEAIHRGRCGPVAAYGGR